MKPIIFARIRTMARDRRGVILVITALLFPVLLAFMSLSLDGGMILDKKRRQQKAADAAALDAAHELFRANSSLVTPAARDGAAMNQFVHKELPGGDPDVTVTVNPYTFQGSTSFVEVIIEEVNVPVYFLRVLGWETVSVASRAVAGLVVNYDDACVLALNPTMRAALKVAGNGTLTANCGVMVNSTDPEAISSTGNACLNSATWIGTAGGVDLGSTCVSPQPETDALAMYDPLKYMPQPPMALPAPPDFGNVQVNAALCEDETPNPAFTCDAGTYVWKVGQYNSLRGVRGSHRFTPGMYVITREMDFNTSGDVTGTEVGFYGTEFGGSNWQGISITAQGTLDLSAPLTGPMKGMLIWLDRTMPYSNSGTVKIEGGVTTRWKGSIYAPSQHVDFGGHSNSQGDWAYIIGDNIDVHGGGALDQLTGPSTGTPGAPDVFKATLVE